MFLLDTLITKPDCSLGEFRCADGGCLNPTYVCDGISDCADSSDESGTADSPICGMSKSTSRDSLDMIYFWYINAYICRPYGPPMC